jgi:hypothetical protein
MRRARALAFVFALATTALLLPASAQDAAAPGLRQRMSAADFRAAGLDKLSPEELARLDAWMNQTLGVETKKAADQASALTQNRIEQETRGFFSFGSSEPIVSTLTGRFNGFARNRLYTLANGQQWRQIDDASLVGVRLDSPEVRINPSIIGNAWYLAVKGYNTRAKVIREK